VVGDLALAYCAAFCAGLVAIYGTWVGTEWRGAAVFFETGVAVLFGVSAYRGWVKR
jgi:hypothetical protein